MKTLEVDSAGREGSHHEPLHYVLLGPVYADKTGVIADTLNCWQIDPAEQRKWMDQIAYRFNNYDNVQQALKDLLAEIDGFEEIPQQLSGATLCRARQAAALPSHACTDTAEKTGK